MPDEIPWNRSVFGDKPPVTSKPSKKPSTTQAKPTPQYKPEPQYTPQPRLQPESSSIPWGVIIGIGCVLLVVLFFVFARLAASQSQATTSTGQSSTAPATYQTNGSVHSLAWSHTGKYVAVAADGDVEIWDVGTQQKVLSYTQPADYAASVSWSPDDTKLVSCTSRQNLYVWDASGKTLFSLSNVDANSVAWSPDGRYIAYSGSNDSAIVDASSGTVVRKFTGLSGWSRVQHVQWTPDSTAVVGLNEETEIDMWSLSGNDRKIFQDGDHNIYDIALSSDGTKIAVGEYSGDMKIVDAGSGQIIASGKTDLSAVSAIAYSQNGKIAVGGFDQTSLEIMDEQGNKLQTFDDNGRPDAGTIDWSPDGTSVAVGVDTTVQIFAVS